MQRIGVDEAGKGDYFGYLVIAGVFVDEKTEEKLKALGVKDSKKLSDSAVKMLAMQIKKLCKYDIVTISPEKYNKLYKKFSSLNKLLAWGHARAIENLLSKVQCNLVVTDKFAEDRFVNEALMEKGRAVKVEQRIKADEKDTAVAAASILARDEFLKTLRALGREVGCVLPKGATHVEDTAKDLIEKHGQDILNFVAKTHFKTTKRVLRKA